MDMSVKLNQPYPAAAPQSAPAPKSNDPQQTKVDPTVATVEPKQDSKPSDLEQAVTDIRKFVQATQRNLDFSIDDSTKQVVVKVIATDTGEVIRQIPSEMALKLAESLHDAGNVLFNAKV
jgi:flagellar protein FlaG